MVDHELKERCIELGFEIPAISPIVESAAPEIAAMIAAYGLPPKLARVIVGVEPVEVIDVDREVAIPKGVRHVNDALLLSAVSTVDVTKTPHVPGVRELIVEISSGEVLFFTPQRDHWMNASFEAFVRCVVASLPTLIRPMIFVPRSRTRTQQHSSTSMASGKKSSNIGRSISS